MSVAVEEIMEFTDRRLKGSGLNFALVLWKPGLPNGNNSIGIACPLKGQSEEIAKAMHAAAAVSPLMTEAK